jgi:oxalate---CoA ligase
MTKVFIVLDRLGDVIKAESAPAGQTGWLAESVKLRTELLRWHGVSKGVPVALSQTASPEFFADLLAIWSCGAQAICLDVALTSAERANVAAFSSAKLVLLAHGGLPGSWSLQTLMLSDLVQERKAKTAPQTAGAMLDDPALILFTSGTTGDPKGVVHSFRSIQARLALNAMAIGLGPSDTALLTLPVHFGHGLIGNALSPLFAGARLVVPPKGLTLASRLGSIIDEHGITFLSSVPALWRMAMKLSPKPKSSSLRRVHVGSAPLSIDLLHRIEDWVGCEVHNCYGITETANWISGASSRDPLMRDGFVGRPWGGSAAVLTTDGLLRATGEGETVVQSPSLMSGYLARPDLTSAAFIDGWYRTGDWGNVDSSGNICLSGRLKDEINRAGFKVQPAEIDMLLERHDNIEEACTFGISDMLGTEIVAAAVKLKDNSKETPDTLRAWCLERLRRDATPERWFIVEEIPKTSRGKLRRDAVRKTLLGE